MKLGHVGMMLHVGPLFVLYALLLDPGCCTRAHFELDGHFQSEKTKKRKHQPFHPIGHVLESCILHNCRAAGLLCFRAAWLQNSRGAHLWWLALHCCGLRDKEGVCHTFCKG